jgi:hypothetical protein
VHSTTEYSLQSSQLVVIKCQSAASRLQLHCSALVSALQRVRSAMHDLQLFGGHCFAIEVNGSRGDSMP